MGLMFGTVKHYDSHNRSQIVTTSTQELALAGCDFNLPLGLHSARIKTKEDAKHYDARHDF
jgi:hypothetical protein